VLSISGTTMEIRVRSFCAILEYMWLDIVLYIIKYTYFDKHLYWCIFTILNNRNLPIKCQLLKCYSFLLCFIPCSFILNKLYNYIFIYSERPSTKHFYLMLRKLNHRLIMIMMNICIYCFLCFRWTTQAKVRGFLQEQESNGTSDERLWDSELDHTSRSSVWSQYHLRSTFFLPRRWTRLEVCHRYVVFYV